MNSQDSDYLNANHDALIISVITVFSALSLIALCLRLASKRIKRASLKVEDYLAIISWVVTLAFSIIVGSGIRFAGLGRHGSTVPVSKVTALLKAYYCIEFLQTTALATAKLSVLCLLHRIFVTRSFRITVWVLGVIIVLWWTSITAADAFICSPIRSNWEPMIPKHCGNDRALLLIAPVPWILTDFAILIAPLFVIKNLQLKRKDKIGLFALFLTGGLTCIVACYRYKTLFYRWTDPTWDMVNIGIWSIIETNVSVICICIITIKPALQRLFPSSMILKTRQGWSKLRSSRLRWGHTHDSSNNISQSKPAARSYSSFARLHESAPYNAAATNGLLKTEIQMPDHICSIPLEVTKIDGRRLTSTDELV